MGQQALFITLLLFAGWGIALAGLGLPQVTEPHSMNAPSAVSGQGSAAPAKSEAEERASQRFSEFNHRFAGLFVLLVGLLTLLEPRLARRFSLVRYLWSLLFFLPGLYLFFFSDPESWPVGSQSLHYVITSNMQVLQHKVFSLLLLGLSVVEFLRAQDKLKSLWTAALFPALAAVGVALLFFHSPPGHAGNMSSSAHLAMQKIQHQHIGFAVVGFGIALSKGALDTGRFHPRLMRKIFAALMMVLGALLLTYAE